MSFAGTTRHRKLQPRTCWRGDFRGLIDQLDYIKALGFTAIWITPVVQNGSGYDYHGYHAMDFSKVDCRYQGVTGEDAGKSGDVMFQELIDAAHKKGLKIILDIVLNHTGNFGEAGLLPEFTQTPTYATRPPSMYACSPIMMSFPPTISERQAAPSIKLALH